MAIEIALLGHVEMRDPGLAVENPPDLLQTDHWSLIAVRDATSSNHASTEVSRSLFLPKTRTKKIARGT